MVGAGASVVINEFATRGSGSSEEFVEVRNDSARAMSIGGWQIRAWTRVGGTPTIIVYFTFPGGTTLDPGCHYLVAMRDSIEGVAADTRVPAALTLNAGLALVRDDGTIIDQVGLDPASPFKEGTTLPPQMIDDTNSYTRVGNDTNDNAFDFAHVRRTPMNSASSCAIR